MARIKLKTPGMESFSSYMGTVQFENGVSVEDVSTSEINRLAALTNIALIDEDGNEMGQAGLGAAMVGSNKTQIAPAQHSQTGTDDFKVEETPGPADFNTAPAPVDPIGQDEKDLDALINETGETDEIPPMPETVYERAELEKIADEKGIAGLREIADPMGVKDNSINGLIKEILQAQGDS